MRVVGKSTSEESVGHVRLDHLGLAAQMAEEIQLMDTIDTMVGGVDGREIVSTGQAIQAIAINCLGFTSKSMQLTPQFFRTRDIKFLLGRNRGRANIELEAEHLNEHRLGRALDALAEADPEKVFMSIAFNAFRKEGVKVPNLHLDTTTHSFYGTYVHENGDPKKATFKSAGAKSEPVEVLITHGFSKESRESCKQMVQELLVSSDGDVPLMMKAYSGNAADIRVFQERITELKKQFINAKAEDLFPKYVVGDSKLYSQESISQAHTSGLKFITRVPDNIVEAKKAIAVALSQKDWMSETAEKKEDSQFFEIQIEKFGIAQKFIVVKSKKSFLIAEKSTAKMISKERDSIDKIVSKLKKEPFYCEKDLYASVESSFQKLKFHEFTNLNLASKTQFETKGRPKKGELGTAVFSIEKINFRENKQKIEQYAQENSCFVLGTNDLNASPQEIIDIYRKDRQGVERSFRFLKDPQYFADAFFLKNPNRIVALLTVMTIALLLYSLLQRRLRLNLKAQKKGLPNQNKKDTAKPTIRWVNMNFEGVGVTIIKRNKNREYFFHYMLDFVSRTLEALGENYVRRYSIECLT